MNHQAIGWLECYCNKSVIKDNSVHSHRYTSKERFSPHVILFGRKRLVYLLCKKERMLKNTHHRWKKARCIYLGNTHCVPLMEEEYNENS